MPTADSCILLVGEPTQPAGQGLIALGGVVDDQSVRRSHTKLGVVRVSTTALKSEADRKPAIYSLLAAGSRSIIRQNSSARRVLPMPARPTSAWPEMSVSSSSQA